MVPVAPRGDRPVFPPHLAQYIDVACHLLDARLPNSTLWIEQNLRGKELLVLNKADLAPEQGVREWVGFFRRCGYPAVPVCSTDGSGFMVLGRVLLEWLERKSREREKLGIARTVLRVAVVGLPNVGKSTFINRLVGRRKVRVGDVPGITRGHQWIRVLEDVDLLDTPGVIPLSAASRSKQALFAVLNLAPLTDDLQGQAEETLFELLRDHLRGGVLRRYQLDQFPDTPYDLYWQVAEKLSLRLRGGKLNLLKAFHTVRRDLNHGRLGRLMIEKPPPDCGGIYSPLFEDRSQDRDQG